MKSDGSSFIPHPSSLIPAILFAGRVGGRTCLAVIIVTPASIGAAAGRLSLLHRRGWVVIFAVPAGAGAGGLSPERAAGAAPRPTSPAV
jgi:hypothetical protein